MALKQVLAVEAFKQAGCEVITTSLCEITNGWLALVNTEVGKRLATAVKGENPLRRRQAERVEIYKGIDVEIMALLPINAAEVRHNVKWTAPIASGVKGTTVGFTDYLNLGDAFLTDLFVNRQMRPVLIDISPAVLKASGMNLMTAMDSVTWSVLEAGYKGGFGAAAADLQVQTENFHGFDFNADIYKALGAGYKTIGLECSDKIDLSIEKLTDEQVEKRFEQFNEVFRAAVDASYLKVEFKVGNSKISFQPVELHRIVLEYGEAIMHIQNVYNTFLKSAPWEIDFEISISKPGKQLSPQEHCLIANELQRNNIKVASFCLDAANDAEALKDDIQVHCDIAETYEYRLSIKNADIAMPEPSVAMKALKGKIHFKANNILWMSAIKMIAATNEDLYAQMTAAVNTEAVVADALCGSATTQALCKNYAQILENSALLADIKSYLQANMSTYTDMVKQNVANCFLKRF